MSGHAGRAHALLSASGAERWLNCTPSARLEEQLEDTTSDYAKEGTLAHEIAELKLRKHFLEPMGPRKFNAALKKLQANPLYNAEMLTYTDAYLEYIQGVVHSYSAKPHLVVEAKLDYSHIAPEGFGTGDCLIIGGDTLHVIDFKYGKSKPVLAESNPQLMLYALGALQKYAMLYAIKKVVLVIMQPRLDSTSEWETTADALCDWGVFTVRPKAQLAFAGEGDFAAGEWCRFCRAKAQCRARADTMTALEAFGGMKPPLISNDEVGEILQRAKHLAKWASDLEEYALKSLLAGESIAGWKAVAGRSNRQFIDTDKAFAAVKASGIDDALLYERKPITLTAVETLLGKKDFAELLSEHVTKGAGKPTLAEESDKREAITNNISAAEAFSAPQNGGNE